MPMPKGESEAKNRVLFVDDEESIRLMLPAILEEQGFVVTTAASVAEALSLITEREFDILISDLNIGQPADGFIVVSAMRRMQPSTMTYILTGYPDFQTALEAIRQQVDDYLTKPVDVEKLVAALKGARKVAKPIGSPPYTHKRVGAILRENSARIIDDWLTEVKKDEELTSVRLSDTQRTDHLPLVLETLIQMLEGKLEVLTAGQLTATIKHGATRKEQGYNIRMLVRETRIFHHVISNTLQGSLLEIDLSTLISDAMKIGEILNAFLEASIPVFHDAGLEAA